MGPKRGRKWRTLKEAAELAHVGGFSARGLVHQILDLHPACRYPDNPCAYFENECAGEVAKSNEVCKRVRIYFRSPVHEEEGFFDMPAPLVAICLEYFASTWVGICQRIIRECRSFITDGGFDSLLKSRPRLSHRLARAEAGIYPTSVAEFGYHVETRAHRFLPWFRMREMIPASLPIKYSLRFDVDSVQKAVYQCTIDEKTLDLPHGTVEVHNEQSIINFRLIFYEGASFRGIGNFRNPYLECSKSSLSQAIASHPHMDLIGPCLNTAKCNSSQIDACIREIVKRESLLPAPAPAMNFNVLRLPPIERPLKTELYHYLTWRNRITLLFVGIAAMRIFVEASDKLPSPCNAFKRAIRAEWNKFHDIYQFAEGSRKIQQNQLK
jgi:hypothetical protein